MPELNLGRLPAIIAPAVTAARTCWPACRGDVLRILALSGLAVALEAGGLGLIYYLIRLYTYEPVDSVVSRLLPWLVHSPLGLTLSSVALLSAGVRLKYRVIRQTTTVAYKAGTWAGQLALQTARELFAAGAGGAVGEKERRAALNVLLKDVPFVCGYVTGGLSLASLHAVQAFVMILVLMYLSPLLTLLLLALTVVAFNLMAHSYESVLQVASERRQNRADTTDDTTLIGQGLFDTRVTDDAFTAESRQVLTSGSAHRHLALRLAQRREVRSGSLVLEYLYPVAVLCVSLLYTSHSSLAPPLSELALYFLLMRQTISSLYAMGNTLMSFSRHEYSLAVFHALVGERRIPEQLFKRVAVDDDEE